MTVGGQQAGRVEQLLKDLIVWSERDARGHAQFIDPEGECLLERLCRERCGDRQSG